MAKQNARVESSVRDFLLAVADGRNQAMPPFVFAAVGVFLFSLAALLVLMVALLIELL